MSAQAVDDRVARLATRRARPAATRRHHAARGSRGAALIASASTTVGLAAYFYAGSTSGHAVAAPSVASPARATASMMTDGTFTGATATNKWGPVQVQITVSGGSITQVDLLQVPDGNSKDVSINNRAVPVLVQSTLTAQSAQINSVSGATYTSTSYKQSLQSAIDQASAGAGATN